MKRLKSIALFVTNDLTYDQRMLRIVKVLSEAGYNCTLVGRSRPRSLPFHGEGYETKRFSCWINRGPLFYLEINLRILFYIAFNKFDLLVANDLDTLLGVRIGAQLKNRPFAFDAHEWFTEVPELLDKKRIRKIWGAIERWCVPRAHLRYTVNDSLSEIFNDKLSVPFGVIRNVPIVRKNQSIRREAWNSKVLLYQGALNAGRGLEALILAMQSLPEMKLWLVGEGDLSQSLRDMTADNQLESQVKFWGYQTPDNLASITAKATVGFNLLEEESKNYYYSLANKFFDYMHAGIPSINRRFPEYINILIRYQCGITIDKCDPERIVEAIHLVTRSEPSYNVFCDQADRAALVFNWESESTKLIKYYDDIFK